MSDIQQFLEVLELTPEANWDDVTQAYRDLIKIWHPDRFAHDEKLRARAEIKSKQLNEAVRQLRRHYRRTRLYKRSEVQEAVQAARSGIFQTVKGVSKKPNHGLSSSFIKAKVEQRYDASRSGSAVYQALTRKKKCISRLTQAATVLVFMLCFALVASTGIPHPSFPVFQPNPMLLPRSRPLHDYRSITPAPNEQPKTASSPVGGKLSQATPDSRPALIDAAANCKPELLEQLLKQGQNINVADNNGDTALAWAARRNCASVAKLLLDAGIKADTVARNGFTPKDWAQWAKSSKVAALLPK